MPYSGAAKVNLAPSDLQRESLRLHRIDEALCASPGAARLLLSKAQCLMALGRRSEACEAAAAVLSAASADAPALDAAGSFFSFTGNQQQALRAFDLAVSLAPDNTHFIYNRATVHRFLGNLPAAEADYNRVIALRPHDFEAYLNRSELRTQTADNNHIAQLEVLAAQGFAEWRSEVQIRHALAKEYEDLGDFALALPNAKIVHLTHHPMAACYARYKTLFKDGYPFSYDLDEIAQYYAAYRRLMAHWCDTMPGAIHTLSYEGLVADQLTETRTLLAFCDLEWQEPCAEFHRNPAATTTASASQVRRPMYDSSVAQWRHYATELAPLSYALKSASIEV